jgi:hypothetical protein
VAYATKTATLLSKIATLANVTGMGTVYTGVPESLNKSVCAYVTLGGMVTRDQALSVKERVVSILVTFAYRVGGAEATAETSLAVLVDLFIDAIEADPTLTGSCYEATLDFGMASNAQYITVAGAEYRQYPVTVVCEQTK